MTEKQLRQKVADIINGWVGATRGSARHLEILKIYNTHKPLARGYAVQVKDAYCATTVSAAYIKAGIAEYTGTECGVEKYTEVAKRLGIWVENDAHTPKIGDTIVYDWDDNGNGDCTGYGDHVGIVTKISGNAMVITEGNMSGGKVGTRAMQVNAKYIRGYICPNFAKAATGLDPTTPAEPVPEDKARFHTVARGETLGQIANRYDTTVATLAEINGIRNVNLIRVGQEIRLPDTPAAEPAPESKPQGTCKAHSHTVAKGETLGEIASRYDTTVAALAEINGIRNVNLIHVGQVIHLSEVSAATAKLERMGVINSPDYWNGVATSGVVKWLDTLLIQAAEKITRSGPRLATVEQGVDALVSAGIINTPAYWLENYDKAASLGLLLRALGGAVK